MRSHFGPTGTAENLACIEICVVVLVEILVFFVACYSVSESFRSCCITGIFFGIDYS